MNTRGYRMLRMQLIEVQVKWKYLTVLDRYPSPNSNLLVKHWKSMAIRYPSMTTIHPGQLKQVGAAVDLGSVLLSLIIHLSFSTTPTVTFISKHLV